MNIPQTLLHCIICSAGLIVAGHASAENHPLRFLETAFSLYNPDWEARENASGLTLRGSLPVAGHVRLNADINFLETDPVLDRPVRKVSGKAFKNWRTAGVGVFGDGPQGSLWTVDVNYAAVDVEGSTEHGANIMLGAQTTFDKVDVAVGAGYLDLALEDSILEFAVAFEIAPRWSATARIRDYADWDYTLYELGVRWQPQNND